MVESEAHSAFTAQDLRVRDRAAVSALIVIGLAPLFLHRLVIPLQLWWIDFRQVQHIMAFAVIDFLQTPHCGTGPGFVSTSLTCRRCWGDICGGAGEGDGLR